MELDTPAFRALVCLAKVFRAVNMGYRLTTTVVAVVVPVELRTVPESAVWGSSVRFLGRLFITQAEVQQAPMTRCHCKVDSGEGVPAVRDMQTASVEERIPAAVVAVVAGSGMTRWAEMAGLAS